jgi:hypothetical protein
MQNVYRFVADKRKNKMFSSNQAYFWFYFSRFRDLPWIANFCFYPASPEFSGLFFWT